MTLFRGFADSDSARYGFVSIGNFDGVHRGHQRILGALTAHAKALGVPSVVLTFEPHPIQLLRPEEAPPRLSQLEAKSRLIHDFGVDHVIAYPTDEALLNLSPEEFFTTVIETKLAARGLVEGPNFFYGKGRTGSIDTLQLQCHRADLQLHIVAPEQCEGKMISSSSIRRALNMGDVADAAWQLGRPYSVSGRVQSGHQRGRLIGFPTANLHGIGTLVPAEGVYACLADTQLGVFPAAVSIGRNPTFFGTEHKVEAHLIGFQGDLYNTFVELKFLAKLRDQQTFDGIEQLSQQLQKDVTAAANAIRDALQNDLPETVAASLSKVES